MLVQATVSQPTDQQYLPANVTRGFTSPTAIYEKFDGVTI